MAVPLPRAEVPASVAKGEVFPVKVLISHAMETGLRRDDQGKVIPRKIINKFACHYGGEVVFSVDLDVSVAANPFIEFYLRATDSGSLEFIWKEDGGAVYSLTHQLAVG